MVVQKMEGANNTHKPRTQMEHRKEKRKKEHPKDTEKFVRLSPRPLTLASFKEEEVGLH